MLHPATLARSSQDFGESGCSFQFVEYRAIHGCVKANYAVQHLMTKRIIPAEPKKLALLKIVFERCSAMQIRQFPG